MTTPYSRKPRPRRWLLKAAILGGLLASGYWFWQQSQAAPSATDKYQFSEVRLGDIEDLVTATGSLQPRDYVDVGTQVSGQLTKILVSVGSNVEKGELLAEIDPVLYRAQVDASRAQLKNQKAQQQEREAQLALAKLQYQRQLNLKQAEATTTESLQQAKLSLDSSLAQLASIHAQIEQTESSLRADSAKLEYAKIYAPMSGTVVSITARQGQTLNSNQQAPIILRIADLSTMTVKTQVSEADVSKLKLGMPAYFTTLGSKEQRWHGQLQQIEPTPEVVNNVVLYNALFDVPNPDQRLMTQMTAQVFFVVAERRQVLTLPVSVLNHTATDPHKAGSGQRERSKRRPDTATAATEAQPQTAPSATPEHRTNADSQTAQTTPAGASEPRDDAPRPRRHRERSETGSTAGRSVQLQIKTQDGNLERREVRLGLSNRILTEVISGLREGEQVVSGVKTTGPKAAVNSMPPGLGAGMMRR